MERYEKLSPDDDTRVPNVEPMYEEYTYSGPSYPDDDKSSPNRTVYVPMESDWYNPDGSYCGPKWPD